MRTLGLFRLPLLAAGLVLGAGLSLVACLDCTEIACVGGFDWKGEALDGAPLTEGRWTFDVLVEDSRYEVECVVASTLEGSACDPAERIEGEQELIVDAYVSATPESEDWDPSAPPTTFGLRVVDRSGSDAEGVYSEVRGPQDVTITLHREGEEVTSVAYQDLAYERDHDFWGDADCGFCDSLIERSHTW